MTKPPPSILLALLLGALLGVFAIGAAFALRLPNLGIDVDVGPKGQLLIVAIKQPDQPIALPATLIAISSTQGSLQRVVLENDHHLIAETQTAPISASGMYHASLAAKLLFACDLSQRSTPTDKLPPRFRVYLLLQFHQHIVAMNSFSEIAKLHFAGRGHYVQLNFR